MSDEIDILSELESTDFSKVETGMPLLPAALYEVEVQEADVSPNKAGTGHNAKFKLGLTQPTTDLTGKPVNPGFPIFVTMSLVRTPKYDPLKNIAQFMECFTGNKSGKFLPVQQFIGQKGNIRLSVTESEQYGKQNAIARYVKKA